MTDPKLDALATAVVTLRARARNAREGNDQSGDQQLELELKAAQRALGAYLDATEAPPPPTIPRPEAQTPSAPKQTDRLTSIRVLEGRMAQFESDRRQALPGSQMESDLAGIIARLRAQLRALRSGPGRRRTWDQELADRDWESARPGDECFE